MHSSLVGLVMEKGEKHGQSNKCALFLSQCKCHMAQDMERFPKKRHGRRDSRPCSLLPVDLWLLLYMHKGQRYQVVIVLDLYRIPWPRVPTWSSIFILEPENITGTFCEGFIGTMRDSIWTKPASTAGVFSRPCVARVQQAPHSTKPDS